MYVSKYVLQFHVMFWLGLVVVGDNHYDSSEEVSRTRAILRMRWKYKHEWCYLEKESCLRWRRYSGSSVVRLSISLRTLIRITPNHPRFGPVLPEQNRTLSLHHARIMYVCTYVCNVCMYACSYDVHVWTYSLPLCSIRCIITSGGYGLTVYSQDKGLLYRIGI
jgi:hypothetical protein